MISSSILSILAAAFLIPSLYRGAIQDLKEFKFAEAHFDSLCVNVAIILTICMYLALFIEGLYFLAAAWLVQSLISSLIFGFIAFRFGGGGDWRAMIFIACIAPFMLINVILASAVCAIIQAIVWLIRPDIKDPPICRKIPFAVSIFCGYVIVLILMVYFGWF